MDYVQIYQQLIDKAKNRKLKGYFERHHIIPKCMGGQDDEINIIRLTGREHYIAHLLLVKIYPKNGALIKAAARMTTSSAVMNRSYNRLYEWLRIKLAEELSKSQSGTGNSQYGKIWIYSLTQKQSKKIEPKNFAEYELAGWKKGRKIKFVKRICREIECNNEYILLTKEEFCSNKCRFNHRKRRGVFYNREKEFIDYYEEEGTLAGACKRMGFSSAGGAYFRIGKKIIEDHLRP